MITMNYKPLRKIILDRNHARKCAAVWKEAAKHNRNLASSWKRVSLTAWMNHNEIREVAQKYKELYQIIAQKYKELYQIMMREIEDLEETAELMRKRNTILHHEVEEARDVARWFYRKIREIEGVCAEGQENANVLHTADQYESWAIED